MSSDTITHEKRAEVDKDDHGWAEEESLEEEEAYFANHSDWKSVDADRRGVRGLCK